MRANPIVCAGPIPQPAVPASYRHRSPVEPHIPRYGRTPEQYYPRYRQGQRRPGNAREAGGRISAGYQTALAVPGFKFHPGAWANGEILYFSHQAAVVTG